MSTALLIAGFHRSGTSYVSQVLAAAGLFIGDDLLGANPSNPYGHHEDREVIDLHDALLRANGLNWRVEDEFMPVVPDSMWHELQEFVARRRTAHVLWGFKDPRVTLFMPVWKHLVPEAKVLGVIRHYTDSSYSLERRHSEQMFRNIGKRSNHADFWVRPNLALKMWMTHNRGLLRHARAHPDDTMIIDAGLLQDGFPIVEALERRWDMKLDGADAAALYDPTVTKSRSNPMRPVDPELVGELDKMWSDLSDLKVDTENWWRSSDE